MRKIDDEWSQVLGHVKLLRSFARADLEARRELVLREPKLNSAIWWAKDLVAGDGKQDFLELMKSWLSTVSDLLKDGRLQWSRVSDDVIRLAFREYLAWRFDERFSQILDIVHQHGSSGELRKLIDYRVKNDTFRDETLDRYLSEKYGLVYQTSKERFDSASRALGLDTLDLGLSESMSRTRRPT